MGYEYFFQGFEEARLVREYEINVALAQMMVYDRIIGKLTYAKRILSGLGLVDASGRVKDKGKVIEFVEEWMRWNGNGEKLKKLIKCYIEAKLRGD